MSPPKTPTQAELEAGLESVRRSPKNDGTVELIVRRPVSRAREILAEGTFDLVLGLVGDNWKARGSRHMPDGSAHNDAQVTIMNSRAVALVAQCQDRRQLAGDQLYIDLDLSVGNLPAGIRLEVGTALLEVTALPHNGCKQFAGHFGTDAVKFVNSPDGKRLRLRGLNARIVRAGVVRVGDVVRKAGPASGTDPDGAG